MSRRRNRSAGTGLDYVAGQEPLPGMDWSRVHSRVPQREGDPLTHPDGCKACSGTGADTSRPEPAGSCDPCGGTGWRS
jgi:hypothetical protein